MEEFGFCHREHRGSGAKAKTGTPALAEDPEKRDLLWHPDSSVAKVKVGSREAPAVSTMQVFFC
jgi:hypothetical protein